VKVSSRWVNQRAVVYLLRRFGCVLCQHQSTLLLTIKPKLDQLGIPLIAIGNSNVKFANKYKEGLKWTGEIYIDPTSTGAKLLSLPRLTAWQSMKRYFLDSRAIKYFKTLSKTYQSADLEGDGQQTGGVFVLGPGVGRPFRYAFREIDNEFDKFADVDAILEAVGWTKDMKENRAESVVTFEQMLKTPSKSNLQTSSSTESWSSSSSSSSDSSSSSNSNSSSSKNSEKQNTMVI